MSPSTRRSPRRRRPAMDAGLRRLSRAANHSQLWLGCAALLAAAGGERGRAAAVNGLASIGLTSAVVNLVLKPLGDRRRPDRHALAVPLARQVTMPQSTSWPSGHSASAFAFATGVGAAWPGAGVPLSVVASLVAYSRVHTGVHYPSDTIAGTVSGVALAPVAVARCCGASRSGRPRGADVAQVDRLPNTSSSTGRAPLGGEVRSWRLARITRQRRATARPRQRRQSHQPSTGPPEPHDFVGDALQRNQAPAAPPQAGH